MANQYQSNRSIISLWLIALGWLLPAFAPAQEAPADKQVAITPAIPAATQAGTTKELAWWQALREAAQQALEARSHRERDLAVGEFIRLLRVGQEKAYRVPIPDNPQIKLLSAGRPSYTDEARQQKISGHIVVAAEFGADGFVGKIEIVKGLG